MSNANKIRILIADDHKMVRDGLAALLGTKRDLEVIGAVGNGQEAVEKALALKPNVVIMDLMMPIMDGVEATREIRKAAPTVQILVLTTFGTSDGIAHAIEAGALGAMMKSADHEELAEAIRKVAGGEQAISEEVALQMKIDPPVPNLTPRQMEILDSMVRGLNNLDIAKQLGIRRDGVKEHVNAILTKIGASNRTEAVAIALRKHLLKA
jgi:NarL family two-component system response regulator LiaR